MTARYLIPAMIAVLATPFVLAQQDRYAAIAQDPHLSAVPRTSEEASRIAAATALTDDFSRLQQFENRPAGAATVRVTDNANAFSLASANISF